MEQEHKLSFTAEQIDENLGKLDKAILSTPQSLTPYEQAQARDNIEVDSIVCSASGEVISINDASDNALKSLIIYGKTTQDGIPSDLVSSGDNGSIIISVAGTNIWDEQWKYGYYRNSGGSHNSTTTGEICTANAIKVMPNTSYVVSCKNRIANYVIFLNKNKSFLSSEYYTNNVPFTTPANAEYMHLNFGAAYGKTYNNDIAVVIGSNPLPYEPYKPLQTLTVSTPNNLRGIPVKSSGNYVDENGQQWICDEIDFARGVYVQRLNEIEFDGSESWELVGTYNGLYRYAYVVDKDVAPISTGLISDQRVISSALPTLSADESVTQWSGVTSECIALHHLTDSTINVFVSNFTDKDAWKRHLTTNKMTVIYQLAQPDDSRKLTVEELEVYKSICTIKPYTTIFNNVGAFMDVTYEADTKAYIDNKIAGLSAAIVNNA